MKSNCFHEYKSKISCKASSNKYVFIFPLAEILLSQIGGFDQIWWLSIVVATMSTIYSTIGMSLEIVETTVNGFVKGRLAGMGVRDLSNPRNIWKMSQALGNIAFAYSYASVQLEIQDTLHSHPVKSMTNTAKWSIAVMTLYNVLCGGLVYATFGYEVGSSSFTEVGFYNPYWLV